MPKGFVDALSTVKSFLQTVATVAEMVAKIASFIASVLPAPVSL